ncbi:MAG TPA: ThiF family adenylyltransferase [Candidatus Paceibacterota bacterium]|nr:ThiF family adenylyltransferase [Verrucomicrobiota bacterium]HSA09330.1 ThiF family adenylyltransferase [Candidatus Paceibacterota bacterium]
MTSLLVLGAGLIGRPLCLLVGLLRGLHRVLVVDRDSYTKAQAWHPADAGRPKAEVAAEMMQAANQRLHVESIVAGIEDLPLGIYRRYGLMLTALDSQTARMTANFAFEKAGIRYWIDSGVSAPSLVRISTFAQGADAPCYECGLSDSDYAAEARYPCQPAFTAPGTNSPQYLGTLAASMQAAISALLLSGKFDPAILNREVVYDVAAQKLFVTRLVRRKTCRLDHGAFGIRPLHRAPARIPLAEAFMLGPGGSRRAARAAASLEVPDKLFVRVLACECGAQRQVLRLKGRIGLRAQTCARCGGRMFPPGAGLTNSLRLDSLTARELARPLSALGLEPADVIAISDNRRTNYYELGFPRRESHD